MGPALREQPGPRSTRKKRDDMTNRTDTCDVYWGTRGHGWRWKVTAACLVAIPSVVAATAAVTLLRAIT